MSHPLFSFLSMIELYPIFLYNTCQITLKTSQILQGGYYMRPIYEHTKESLEIFHTESSHISPHIHRSIECVYVTEGSLELGIAQELHHMEQGDFAIVFPDLIHHYQVFDTRPCKAIYLLASPILGGGYLQTLQQFCPENPVISSSSLHPDIAYTLKSLLEYPVTDQKDIIYQAFIQIILARCLPFYHLVEKNTLGSDDIIYQTVSYIASHFTEKITLTGMAKDLGFSAYALSRVFSGTFHTNFNQYLNDARLDYVSGLLQYTNQSITEAYENAGFDSQRTFNRVFKARYHMSPREYRNLFSSINR